MDAAQLGRGGDDCSLLSSSSSSQPIYEPKLFYDASCNDAGTRPLSRQHITIPLIFRSRRQMGADGAWDEWLMDSRLTLISSVSGPHRQHLVCRAHHAGVSPFVSAALPPASVDPKSICRTDHARTRTTCKPWLDDVWRRAATKGVRRTSNGTDRHFEKNCQRRLLL